MLKVTSNINLTIVEELIRKIHEDQALSNEILVPVKLNYKGFGTFPSLIQFYNTCLRQGSERLIIPIEKSNDEGFKDFAQSFHGYFLLLMAWQKTQITNSNNDSIKFDFRPHTTKMYDLIDFLDTSLPKEEILLPCFDHFPIEKGLVNWLYYGRKDFPESEEILSTHLYRALQQSIRNYKSVVSAKIGSIFDDLTGIIWELMKNTDEWAKKDHLNERLLSPSGRGVFIKFHRNSVGNLNTYADGHQGLLEYYSWKEDLLSQQKYYLEVSVYDSGPGLVKRFMGKDWRSDISIEQEVGIVKKCLTVHSTSATGMNKDHKGAGLDRSLNLLSEMNGFIRIRTGNVSLYRDLVAHPYQQITDSEQIKLFDWIKCDSLEFTKMPPTTGTLITLAFPLN